MKRDFCKTLEYLNELRLEHRGFKEVDFLNHFRTTDRGKMVKMLEELKAQGYLDALQIENGKSVKSVSLSYRGMTYREENRAEFLKKCLDWFTQNLVGLAALIVSIIALIRSL